MMTEDREPLPPGTWNESMDEPAPVGVASVMVRALVVVGERHLVDVERDLWSIEWSCVACRYHYAEDRPDDELPGAGPVACLGCGRILIINFVERTREEHERLCREDQEEIERFFEIIGEVNRPGTSDVQ